MTLSITTSIHVDLSYLNNFIWKLKEHELQQYNMVSERLWIPRARTEVGDS